MQPGATELSRDELRIREERAKTYDADYMALHGPWFLQVEAEFLRSLLDLGTDDVVLDLGCGTGRLMPLYAPVCRRAYAVDRSPVSLGILDARARAAGFSNVTPMLCDATEPLYLPEPVSRVLCVQVLQHVPSVESRHRVVRNAAEALGSGGRALFVDEADGWVRRARGKGREIADRGRLFFHPFRVKEYALTIASGGLSVDLVRGLGICYWARYRPTPRLLAQADIVLSRMPGSSLAAKFLGAVATPNRLPGGH